MSRGGKKEEKSTEILRENKTAVLVGLNGLGRLSSGLGVVMSGIGCDVEGRLKAGSPPPLLELLTNKNLVSAFFGCTCREHWKADLGFLPQVLDPQGYESQDF